MSSTKKHSINKKSSYFQQFKKKLIMWVPPSVETDYFENQESPNIMELVYYIEANNIERIDTSIYNDSFEEFYYLHLTQYDNNKTEFCSNIDGGVNKDYVIDIANDYITIMSVDDLDYVNIVYALISFRLVDKSPDTIMVETLCGNQTINSKGEGTRLLNFVKNMAHSIGIRKIALHPVDTAVQYYKQANFRTLNSDEADLINSSDEDTPPETMIKDTPSQRRWAKIKTIVKVLGAYTRDKKFKETILDKTKEIKRFHKAKYNEKTGQRGTLIPAPFSTPTIKYFPRGAPVGKIKNVVTTNEGTLRTIIATPVIPGASLRIAKLKSDIQDAALMTNIREAEAITQTSKTKKGSSKKASGTRKRKNKRNRK